MKPRRGQLVLALVLVSFGGVLLVWGASDRDVILMAMGIGMALLGATNSWIATHGRKRVEMADSNHQQEEPANETPPEAKMDRFDRFKVALGYLSQFLGGPVILPALMFPSTEAPRARTHLARAFDLQVLTYSVVIGLVLLSAPFADSSPFKTAAVVVIVISVITDVALVIVAVMDAQPRWAWRPVLLRCWINPQAPRSN